jgi:hypothetical protein
MGGKRTERHRWKEHIYSLYQELQADYGPSVIESRSLVARLSDFIDESYEDQSGLRRPGQIRHVVVADGQPAGRLKKVVFREGRLWVLHKRGKMAEIFEEGPDGLWRKAGGIGTQARRYFFGRNHGARADTIGKKAVEVYRFEPGS